MGAKVSRILWVSVGKRHWPLMVPLFKETLLCGQVMVKRAQALEPDRPRLAAPYKLCDLGEIIKSLSVSSLFCVTWGR